MATGIVGAIVFAVVVLAVRQVVRDHLGGKGGCNCGGSCAGCPGSAYCHPPKKAEKQN